MIVREIRDNPDLILSTFDYFNDYNDTRKYCECHYPELVERLDSGFEEYLKKERRLYGYNALCDT